MTTDNEIYAKFIDPLWSDLQSAETFTAKRPLLAHYTSIAVLECIMDSNEVWFSNPLYMNDMEELRFGILEGASAFRLNEEVKSACGSAERYKKLLHGYEYLFDQFSNQHAFDIYVFCLSEHDRENTDGLLSLWRGYGGNGSGAAIIFDTSKLNEIQDSPLIISKVTYASQDKRRDWIDEKLNAFADLIKNNKIPDDKLYLPAYALFERIKIFSIFTKHSGFSEEREWRVVYMKERDSDHKIDSMLHYAVGRRGIEPKFKFKICPIEGVTSNDLSIEKIIHKIILGPSVSSPLAISAVKRMLEKVGKHELTSKVIASTTPFRPL